MGTPLFTPGFKEEAVRQITERGYPLPKYPTVLEFTEYSAVSAVTQCGSDLPSGEGAMVIRPTICLQQLESVRADDTGVTLLSRSV